MPWTAADATRHTKLANSPVKAQRWAAVANAVLSKSGDEGKAIRIANDTMHKAEKKRVKMKGTKP